MSPRPDKTTHIRGSYRAKYVRMLVALVTTVLVVECGREDKGTSPGTDGEPPAPRGVPSVRGPSIMGPDPVVVTDKDRLHAKILYQRPAGSTSPDRDPFGVTIN